MNSKIIGGNNKRRVEQRQEQASARQELRWKRSSKEQLERLDVLLGKDIGAVKERERLFDEIEYAEFKASGYKEVDEKTQSDEKANVKKSKARLSPKEIKKLKKQQK